MRDLFVSKFLDTRLSRVAEALSATVQPAIRLKTFPCREDELQLGASRIGGKPDLTDDIVWPVWHGKPLSFLAQIKLSDLAQYPFTDVLPEEGWLLFFYDAEQSTWGFDPEDKGSWAVVFIPSTRAKLERRGVPSDVLMNGFYNLCGVETLETLTLPPFESHAVERLNLSDSEQDAYLDLLDEVYSSDEELVHQLLGHPRPIQGDMQLECQLVSRGLYCGDLTGYNDPKASELAKGVEDWRLLFQLDSDDYAEMMWGDVGRLYFWIQYESLAARDFDKCWMVLQCG